MARSTLHLTGLTPAQIEIGVRWQAMAAADWRSRVGQDDSPDDGQA